MPQNSRVRFFTTNVLHAPSATQPPQAVLKACATQKSLQNPSGENEEFIHQVAPAAISLHSRRRTGSQWFSPSQDLIPAPLSETKLLILSLGANKMNKTVTQTNTE